MKPKLKAPGTKRLKLKCDILLSTSAFKFNLRRYPKSPAAAVFRVLVAEDSRANQMAISRLLRAQGVDVTVVDDGSAAVVGWCGLTLSIPR